MAKALMVVLVELLKSVSQDVILNITNNVRSRSLFCLQRSMSYGFFTPPFPFQRYTDGPCLASVLRERGRRNSTFPALHTLSWACLQLLSIPSGSLSR